MGLLMAIWHSICSNLQAQCPQLRKTLDSKSNSTRTARLQVQVGSSGMETVSCSSSPKQELLIWRSHTGWIQRPLSSNAHSPTQASKAEARLCSVLALLTCTMHMEPRMHATSA